MRTKGTAITTPAVASLAGVGLVSRLLAPAMENPSPASSSTPLVTSRNNCVVNTAMKNTAGELTVLQKPMTAISSAIGDPFVGE